MAIAIVIVLAAHHLQGFLVLLVTALEDPAIVGVCSAAMGPYYRFILLIEVQLGKAVAFDR